MVVSLSGPQPLDQLQQVAKDRVRRAFEAVDGVASVDIAGGPTREIHVNVDVIKLRAYNLGFNSVQQALQTEQVETQAGSLSSAGKNVNVRFNGLVKAPADLGSILVAQQPNGRIYIRDLATIDDSFLKDQPLSRVDGAPAVSFTVTKLPNASSLQLSSDIYEVMAQLEPTLPQGMHFTVSFDIAHYTQQSFNTIQKTLGEAVLFTGLILLLFVHTWRSTLIVLISIPTSVLTTFGFMYVAGLNLNLFSMLTLTLSVGILVDDSIVVLENIARHMGLGDPPWVAGNQRTQRDRSGGHHHHSGRCRRLPADRPHSRHFGRDHPVLRAGDYLRDADIVAGVIHAYAAAGEPLPGAGAAHSHERGQLVGSFGGRWDAAFERIGSLYRRLLEKVLTGRLLRFVPTGGGRRGIGARWLVILMGILSLFAGFAALATGRVGFDVFPSGDQSKVDVTVNMPPPPTSPAPTPWCVRLRWSSKHTRRSSK